MAAVKLMERGPTAPEYLWKSLEGIPEEDIHKITHQNALREFRMDAFARRPREKCTVAALRAESPDVDLSHHSAGGKAATDEKGIVTARDITTQLAAVYTTPPE